MNKVSFVFQNSRLIKASILENVRMAKPDASHEEIAHALEVAQCLDIIEKLPNGIDTVVGTNGVAETALAVILVPAIGKILLSLKRRNSRS